jgi:zinc protease
MAFGADTNAYTAFDETCYKLELPRNEEALVRKGLLLLRDFACGMLLVAEEIDKERGVILSEKRARDSADYRTYVAELRHTPLGVFRDRVTNFIAGGDFRFGFPAKEVALSRTLAEVREWLRDPLSGGYLELSIVGDVELERALEAAAATFGAILTRADEKPALMEARAVRFPRDVVRKTLEYDSRLPKAMALALWPLPDMWDMARTRRLGILTDILRDRLRITLRESEGETYSPIAFSRQSLAYTDYGFLVSGAIVAPPKAEHIVETVRRLGAQLSEEGTSEDELSRALQPALTRLREQLRDNRYWLHSVLSSSQEHPQRLDWARTMQTDFKAIKKAEIDKLAATYLAPARGLAITIVPPPKKDGERRTD